MSINICYCLDRNYLQLVLKSLKSFMKHNKDIKFFFFCKEDIPELRGFGKIINYDTELLKDFDKKLCGYGHVSTACFLRFLIPKYLKDLDRILYVDGDTLCLKNISEFYNSDFEGNYLMGCRGADISFRQAKELGTKEYILSGMLLYDIDKMNKENYFQQILDKWRECIGKPSIFSGDETIINWVFQDKIKIIHEKYNYCYQRKYTGREVPINEVVILHFPGRDKRAFFKFPV